MSAHDNGGPAFPGPRHDAYEAKIDEPGMSLRDWFAGQALTGMDVDGGAPESSARWAYRVADAMLAERAKAEGQS